MRSGRLHGMGMRANVRPEAPHHVTEHPQVSASGYGNETKVENRGTMRGMLLSPYGTYTRPAGRIHHAEVCGELAQVMRRMVWLSVGASTLQT